MPPYSHDVENDVLQHQFTVIRKDDSIGRFGSKKQLSVWRSCCASKAANNRDSFSVRVSGALRWLVHLCGAGLSNEDLTHRGKDGRRGPNGPDQRWTRIEQTGTI